MKKKKTSYLDSGDLKYVQFRIYIIIGIIIFSMGACATLNKFVGMENDNPIEQAAEAIIEAETDISVDLSPGD